MLELDLSGPVFYDKVYGCWLGKNAGGTLGTPLEKAFGQAEPFDVRWYPELREGGLPNDDLEIQLIWLKALEELGPGLTARDLSRYWLDHIGYNFDEYGLSKLNLRLGLEPPISGHYNNWFADCMGCPIRSEIWACVAPGAPRIAARYAYADAICDHAGGESVYGELFNAALESSAFVVGDRRTLLDIARSYLPQESLTARAIRAAIDAYDQGLDWKSARKRVLDATPHYIAQFSPINLGFQVIGLLYGEDFGDGICTTVNCGYDTDSSGAAIGSYLGILDGRSGLPGRWIEPLGDTIATNESWGGVRHLDDGANPIPRNLDELTERIRQVARKVLAAHGALGADGVLRTEVSELYADDVVRELRDRSPTRIPFPGVDLDVEVDYLDTPAVAPGSTKTVVTAVTNRRRDPVEVRCAVTVPVGWAAPSPQTVALAAGETVNVRWRLEVPARGSLERSNRLLVSVVPDGRPAPPAVPVVLIGATAWLVAGPYPRSGRSDAELLALDPPTVSSGAGSTWREVSAYDNGIPIAELWTEPGLLYVAGHVHVPEAMRAWLVVDANCPVTYWLNGERQRTAERYRGLRPQLTGTADSAGPVDLRAGSNELLIGLARDTDRPMPQCHVLWASDDVFKNGLASPSQTRYVWDVHPT